MEARLAARCTGGQLLQIGLLLLARGRLHGRRGLRARGIGAADGGRERLALRRDLVLGRGFVHGRRRVLFVRIGGVGEEDPAADKRGDAASCHDDAQGVV